MYESQEEDIRQLIFTPNKTEQVKTTPITIMLIRFGQSGPRASTRLFCLRGHSIRLLVLGYVLLSSALDFFSQLYCSITEDCFLRVLFGVNVHT